MRRVRSTTDSKTLLRKSRYYFLRSQFVRVFLLFYFTRTRRNECTLRLSLTTLRYYAFVFNE